MEKIVRQSLLYDFYGELLTEHQKSIYEDVTMNDLSYSEIAGLNGISRQGVYDMIKRCDKILEDYETKLKLVERFVKAREKAESIKCRVMDMKGKNINPELNETLDELGMLTDELLDEF